MNKKYKLHFKSLGKVFLLIGLIVVISGFENTNAQTIQVNKSCTEYRCISSFNDYCFQYSNDCINYSYHFDVSQIKPYISTPSIPSASQTAANMTPADADVLLQKMNSTKFKNKIISSVPLEPKPDTTFQKFLMGVMPWDELVKRYDPNYVYQ